MKSGIYIIIGPGKRVYVGQSSDLSQRQKQHVDLLNAGKHHNAELQADWTEKGSFHFMFMVERLCSPQFLDVCESSVINRMHFMGVNLYNVMKPAIEKQTASVELDFNTALLLSRASSGLGTTEQELAAHFIEAGIKNMFPWASDKFTFY